ncbi:ABC transporter permease [Embleya sp. AB8]|uniref:ABC transporter permease n=1 Tax=Embleya sp. AB8 TaxID=3156304 RepID=UPI003C75CF35
MFKASLRGFFAHKGRLVLSALAITLSIAFVTGTLMFVDTISGVLTDLARSTSADVTITPHTDVKAIKLIRSGQQPTVPAALVERVRGVEGVAAVHGDVVVEDAGVVDGKGDQVGVISDPTTVVAGWCACAYSPVRLTSGHEPHGPTEVVLDAESARASGVHLGDRLRLSPSTGAFEVTVVGIAGYRVRATGDTLVFVDPATAAARLLGKPDAVTAVSITAAPGVPDTVLRDRVSAAVGGSGVPVTVRTRAQTGAAAVGDLSGALDVVRYGLLGFALLTMGIGMFLIFNTFSMLIAQRTRELGLLRAIGAGRGDVLRSVLTEAGLLGLVGSTLGLALGYTLAGGLTAALSLLGVQTSGITLVFASSTVLVGYGVGLVATVLAAYFPARRASRVAPMAALRDAEAAQGSLRRRGIGGAVALVVGGGALATGDLTLLALGGALTLSAAVLLGPVLAGRLIPVLAAPYTRLFGGVGRLGRDNALRNPRRTGATAGALMIGVALVAAIGVTASSMTASFDDTFDRTFRADLVITGKQALTPQVAAAARTAPGVTGTVRTRRTDARITVRGESTLLELDGAEPGVATMLGHTYAKGSEARGLAPGAIVLDAAYAKRKKLAVGDSVLLQAVGDGPARTLRVEGLRSDQPAGTGGEVNPLIGLDTFADLVPGARDDSIYLTTTPGTDPAAARLAVKAATSAEPNVTVRTRADYRETRKGALTTMLTLAYGLLSLTIVIAVLGVANTLALSVVERTRELAMLRALGLTRRQIRRMIRLESTTITLFGTALGLTLGLAWGYGATGWLAKDGSVTELAVPWPTLAAVIAATTVAGLLAATIPAWRAARLPITAAIQVDA